MLPDVQYRRAIHTEQSDEKERFSLFCLLMSISEEKFLAGLTLYHDSLCLVGS